MKHYLKLIGAAFIAAFFLGGAHAQNGLVGTYFNNETLTAPVVLTRTERVLATWAGSPGTGVAADNFSVRWTGTLTAPTTGSYTLQTASDAGMRVYLDGVLMISHWTAHAWAYKNSAPIAFTAGQSRDIVVEFHDDIGEAKVQLLWKAPGASTFVVVPLSALSPPAPPAAAIPYPLPVPTGSWQTVATNGQAFNVPQASSIRFGSGGAWQYRQFRGAAVCSKDGMQWWDGAVDACQVYVITQAPTLVQHPAGGPLIDIARIPIGDPGSSVARVGNTTEMPAPSDGTGAFRTVCDFSHMAFDDPIVKPGQQGGSHLHTFYGNTDTNANSTANSISTTGNSTCRGGIANRSSYWIPTMIDTGNGAPLVSNNAGFYYKTGYYGINPAVVQPLPQGLRMIAGDAMNTSAANQYGYFECSAGPGLRGPGIPNCPVGSEVTMHLDFPQCWDGVNLDSPDHKSHVSYPVGGVCPSTHPTAMPVISFIVAWPVYAANDPLRWRFASDNYSTALPGGYSMHGDWFNGWRAAEMQLFVTQCLQPAKDCHSHLLGAGKEIF